MPAELTPAEALAVVRQLDHPFMNQHTIADAFARLAAAVEDAERLDAIIRQRLEVTITYGGWWQLSPEIGSNRNWHANADLRAAIDAARTPAPGERT
jgi:hypothetical protein